MHEVDGIRGIALTLVVLFHVFGHGRVSGGVDVFLVISAYFLTRKLLSRFDASVTTPSDAQPPTAGQQAGWLGRHYSGVLSRLVPSAVIVLLGVMVATWLFAPASQYIQNLREIVASALYYENWELIESQLAYEAAGPATSPLQHFWSLSVQGQFFLAWPLIGFLVFALAKRFIGGYRAYFAALVGMLTALSFVYALYLVAADQQLAYFSTFTRFWELGAGALIAFIPTGFLARSWLREAAVWIGIVMIVLSGFLFDGASLFPGVETLWPVSATLLALFGASRATAPGFASAVLSTAPVRYLSKISYQLYLWHWPVLIFYIQVRGWDSVGPLGAVLVLSASFVLAMVTEWIVSRKWITPGKQAFKWRSVLVPVVSVCLVFGATQFWRADIEEQQRAAAALAEQQAADYIGALANVDPEAAERISHTVPPRPSIDAAYDDKPDLYQHDCVQSIHDGPGDGEVLVCDLDDYGAEKTVVMTGGSHVAQWYSAFREIAKQQHWRLIVIEKNGCRLTTEAKGPTCQEWNEQAPEVIASYDPDVVITLATVAGQKEGRLDKIHAGMVEQWDKLAAHGIQVLGLRDTPRLPFKVPGCLEEHPDDPEQCHYPLSDIYSEDPFADLEGELAERGIELPESFRLLDLTEAISGKDYFEPIVGNVVVYRDHAHLTDTYARTLTPMLADALRAERPDLFTS